MDAERLTELLKKNPQRTRWEFVNFVLEPYGEFQGRAILSQLYRLKEIREVMSMTTELAHEQTQIETWLKGFTDGEIDDHLAHVEQQDANYWVQRLGREAAVDIISGGRISKATMEKAVLLDETNYRAFTETCNTIIRVVGDVTRDVERSMGMVPQLPDGEPQ